MFISSHTPSRKHEITVRFKHHSKTVGPQYRTRLMSEVGGGSSAFGKLADPWLKRLLCSRNTAQGQAKYQARSKVYISSTELL